MKFWTKVAVHVFFECERCESRCVAEDRFGEWSARTFCPNCGACYALYMSVEGEKTICRITMGEMYMPPLQWNDLYIEGLNMGIQGETDRRTQYRSLWQRLIDFIRNR